jgi:hypothetical protein
MSTTEATGYVVALVETQRGTWTLRLKKGDRLVYRKAGYPSVEQARSAAGVYVDAIGARMVEVPREPDA